MHRRIIACILVALIAQAGWVEGETTPCGTASGSDTDYTITPCNVQNNEVFNMVVIGDSIAWGAGLNRDEKYSYLVAKWLSEQLNRPVNVKILAHTGATLEKPETTGIEHQYPDIPSSNPTLFEQADEISNPDYVDLVLVSGGANDVDLKKLCSLDYGFIGTTLDEMQTASWDKIETPMFELLKEMLKKCPNAKIIVTGYYPGISRDSKGLTEFYKAFAPESQFPFSDYKKADDPTQLYELATKADTFYEKSNLALNSAKIRANKESGQNRIEFARIVFPSDKSYGTDNSWLWKIEGTEGNYKTDDHKYDVRDSLAGTACQQMGLRRVCDRPTESRLAAVGHPNVEGAGEYNRTIVQKISENWPDWLHPMVLDFEVSPTSVTSGESFTIDYKVSSYCSKGLKQVELWRKDESSDWQQISTNTLAGETGPTSGTFTDSPSAQGKYWYGVHVVDNTGNCNDERNSNAFNSHSSYNPVEVNVNEKGSDSSYSDTIKASFEEPNYLSDIGAYHIQGETRSHADASCDSCMKYTALCEPCIKYNIDASLEINKVKYDKGIKLKIRGTDEFLADFHLIAKYSQLTGLVGLDDATHDSVDKKIKVIFQGDDKELYAIELNRGDLPVEIDIDVTGVHRLRVKAINNDSYDAYVDLMKVQLWK
jgi:hypothetical protein